MNMNLATDECCYTCQHNRNNFSDDFPCNCEYKNKNNSKQDMWCKDYDMVEDYEDKFN